jgi:hypothetical protein
MNSILDLLTKPVPGTKDEGWMFGDMQVGAHATSQQQTSMCTTCRSIPMTLRKRFVCMQVVLYLYSNITEQSAYTVWPRSRDNRQGLIPGLRYLPFYKNLTHEDYVDAVTHNRAGDGVPPTGLLPQYRDELKVWRFANPFLRTTTLSRVTTDRQVLKTLDEVLSVCFAFTHFVYVYAEQTGFECVAHAGCAVRWVGWRLPLHTRTGFAGPVFHRSLLMYSVVAER